MRYTICVEYYLVILNSVYVYEFSVRIWWQEPETDEGKELWWGEPETDQGEKTMNIGTWDRQRKKKTIMRGNLRQTRENYEDRNLRGKTMMIGTWEGEKYEYRNLRWQGPKTDEGRLWWEGNWDR